MAAELHRIFFFLALASGACTRGLIPPPFEFDANALDLDSALRSQPLKPPPFQSLPTFQRLSCLHVPGFVPSHCHSFPLILTTLINILIR